MTINERINLIFNKKKCIRAIITDTNKRVNIYIILIADKKMFNLGDRTYLIDYDAVYISNGLPTYFYYVDNPEPITKTELKDYINPLDVEIASRKLPISSAELYNAIEETISAKIIRYAEGGDVKIINTILIMGAINLLAIGGCTYFLYTTINKIWLFILENDQLISAIKDALISGIGD